MTGFILIVSFIILLTFQYLWVLYIDRASVISYYQANMFLIFPLVTCALIKYLLGVWS